MIRAETTKGTKTRKDAIPSIGSANTKLGAAKRLAGDG
jgi:hypothetical protein